jgi:hypothetical protein
MSNQLTREQLIRRISIIQEDLNKLYNSLQEQGIDTTIENEFGSSVDTYTSNIQICCEIDSNGTPTDVDGYRVETEWTTEAERNSIKSEKRIAKFDKIIKDLRDADVDGEMMEYVIDKLWLTEQMVKQLYHDKNQSLQRIEIK